MTTGPFKPKKIAPLLEKLDQYRGSYEVKTALKIAPHIFLRPNELAGLLWSEIDFDDHLIRISKERMKTKKPHLVPMSIQVFKALQNLRNVNLDYRVKMLEKKCTKYLKHYIMTKRF